MRPSESFIQQPIRSLQTMLQVISLNDPRIQMIIPDGIYGKTTMVAVNQFQQLYNIPITGIADQNTWDKIVEIYDYARLNIEPAENIEIILDKNESLKLNDEGAYVYFLQTMLKALSNKYPTMIAPDISGNYDTNTYDAVKEFQKLTSLQETGQTDKATWKHIVHQFSLLSAADKIEI